MPLFKPDEGICAAGQAAGETEKGKKLILYIFFTERFIDEEARIPAMEFGSIHF
jgi:hypothetical protein